jgi:glutathionyl-hydroquinone reductase
MGWTAFGRLIEVEMGSLVDGAWTVGESAAAASKGRYQRPSSDIQDSITPEGKYQPEAGVITSM